MILLLSCTWIGQSERISFRSFYHEHRPDSFSEQALSARLVASRRDEETKGVADQLVYRLELFAEAAEQPDFYIPFSLWLHYHLDRFLNFLRPSPLLKLGGLSTPSLSRQSIGRWYGPNGLIFMVDPDPEERSNFDRIPKNSPGEGETLGTFIRRLRLAKGWSQADLARKVGVSPGYINQIEKGDRLPAHTLVVAMSRSEILDFDADLDWSVNTLPAKNSFLSQEPTRPFLSRSPGETFRDFLIRARAAKGTTGWSQQDLAVALKKTPGFIAHLESKKSPQLPSEDLTRQLGMLLNFDGVVVWEELVLPEKRAVAKDRLERRSQLLAGAS